MYRVKTPELELIAVVGIPSVHYYVMDVHEDVIVLMAFAFCLDYEVQISNFVVAFVDEIVAQDESVSVSEPLYE